MQNILKKVRLSTKTKIIYIENLKFKNHLKKIFAGWQMPN